jgi:hypothetical protein
MLNWDSTIVTNQDTVQGDQIAWGASLQADLCTASDGNSATGQIRGKRVMKVLYLGPISEEQYQSERQAGVYSKEMALWDQWRGDPGVEKLQFQKHLLLGLSVMLERSSSCLPPALINASSAILAMDGMRMGFIEI